MRFPSGGGGGGGSAAPSGPAGGSLGGTYPNPTIPVFKRGPKIIVGNAPAGDTAVGCDYLDVGDGVQLQAALTAAGALANAADVWIRPGTIAPAAVLTIPSLVTLRCSGNGSFFSPSGTQRAVFAVGVDAQLFDPILIVPVPAAGATGDTLILVDTEARVKNVIIQMNTQSAGQKANESLRYGIRVTGNRAVITDVLITSGLSFEASGLAQSWTAVFARSASNAPTEITNLNVVQCDIGLDCQGGVQFNNVSIENAHRRGVRAASLTPTTVVAGTVGGNNVHCAMNPTTEECVAVEITTGSVGAGLLGAHIEGLWLHKRGGVVASSAGVRLSGSGNVAQLTDLFIDQFPVSVDVAAGQTNATIRGTARGYTTAVVDASGTLLNNLRAI